MAAIFEAARGQSGEAEDKLKAIIRAGRIAEAFVRGTGGVGAAEAALS